MRFRYEIWQIRNCPTIADEIVQFDEGTGHTVFRHHIGDLGLVGDGDEPASGQVSENSCVKPGNKRQVGTRAEVDRFAHRHLLLDVCDRRNDPSIVQFVDKGFARLTIGSAVGIIHNDFRHVLDLRESLCEVSHGAEIGLVLLRIMLWPRGAKHPGHIDSHDPAASHEISWNAKISEPEGQVGCYHGVWHIEHSLAYRQGMLVSEPDRSRVLQAFTQQSPGDLQGDRSRSNSHEGVGYIQAPCNPANAVEYVRPEWVDVHDQVASADQQRIGPLQGLTYLFCDKLRCRVVLHSNPSANAFLRSPDEAGFDHSSLVAGRTQAKLREFGFEVQSSGSQSLQPCVLSMDLTTGVCQPHENRGITRASRIVRSKDRDAFHEMF